MPRCGHHGQQIAAVPSQHHALGESTAGHMACFGGHCRRTGLAVTRHVIGDVVVLQIFLHRKRDTHHRLLSRRSNGDRRGQRWRDFSGLGLGATHVAPGNRLLAMPPASRAARPPAGEPIRIEDYTHGPAWTSANADAAKWRRLPRSPPPAAKDRGSGRLLLRLHQFVPGRHGCLAVEEWQDRAGQFRREEDVVMGTVRNDRQAILRHVFAHPARILQAAAQ